MGWNRYTPKTEGSPLGLPLGLPLGVPLSRSRRWTKEAIQQGKGARARIRALVALGRTIGMFKLKKGVRVPPDCR